MSRFSPQIAGTRYTKPNYLAQALGSVADNVGGLLREGRTATRQAAAQASEFGFRRESQANEFAHDDLREAERNSRDDAAIARAEKRNLLSDALAGVSPEGSVDMTQQAPDVPNYSRYEVLPGTGMVRDRTQTQGYRDLRTDTRNRTDVSALAKALGETNPLATLVGSMRDPGAAASLVAPELLRGRNRAEGLEDYEAKARIDRKYAPPSQSQGPAPTLVDGRPYLRNGTTLVPMTLPDGKPLPLFGSAKAPTAAAAQRTAYATMAADAARRLGDFDESKPGLGMSAPSATEILKGKIPVFGNAVQSDDFQQRQAAITQIADAWLRYTSGAAVPETEVKRFAQGFTPNFGDKPGALAVKREARKLIVNVLRSGGDPVAARAQLEQLLPGSSTIFQPGQPQEQPDEFDEAQARDFYRRGGP